MRPTRLNFWIEPAHSYTTPLGAGAALGKTGLDGCILPDAAGLHRVLSYQNLASLLAIAVLLLVLLLLLLQRRSRRQALQARKQLRQTAHEYQLLFQRSPMPKWVYDLETLRILAVNQSAIESYGYTREQFLAMTIADIRPAEDHLRLQTILESYTERRSGGTEYSGIWRHRAAGGREILAEIYSHELRFAGRACRMVLALDVTAREAALQQIAALNRGLEARVQARTAELEIANRGLRAANQEMEAFSYSVAHDLRAPLRALDGFSQALVEDCAGQLDATGRGYLARIRSAAQRMAVLIDDLLELSRVTRRELNWQRLNLAELARAIAAEYRRAEPGREIEFLAPAEIEIAGDPAQMRILLVNLLGNAWKFTARHPRARIELGREPAPEPGRQLCFVRDDGAGFDMAWAGKLFRPFQRLHNAGEFPGTGIGLAIVQRIVQRHGGEVSIDAAPERGATVYFSLPVEIPQSRPAPAAKPEEVSHATTALRAVGRG